MTFPSKKKENEKEKERSIKLLEMITVPLI